MNVKPDFSADAALRRPIATVIACYDLVLTDISMPVVDGSGLTEEIRRFEARRRRAGA